MRSLRYIPFYLNILIFMIFTVLYACNERIKQPSEKPTQSNLPPYIRFKDSLGNIGIKDRSGNIRLPAQYKNLRLTQHSPNLFVIKDQHGQGIINLHGDTLVPPIYEALGDTDCDGKFFAWHKETLSPRRMLIDSLGQLLLNSTNTFIHDYHRHFISYNKKNQPISICDCNLAQIPLDIKNMADWYNGTVFINGVNESYSYNLKTGIKETLPEIRFSSNKRKVISNHEIETPFQVAKKGIKYGLLDSLSSLTIPFIYDTLFFDGVGVSNSYLVAKKNNKFGIIALPDSILYDFNYVAYEWGKETCYLRSPDGGKEMVKEYRDIKTYGNYKRKNDALYNF
jgi:hypothetical protein